MIEVCVGHSYQVDWWALAILVHEFLTGHSPFLNSGDDQATEDSYKRRVLKSEPNFHNIEKYPDMKDFLSQLLVKDEDMRLGKNGQVQMALTPIGLRAIFSSQSS